MGETAPLFTVVIPTHGRPELLRRALASVWGQTDPCAEIIIVDDASPESPPASLADSSPMPMRIVTQAVNSGPGACRNLGSEMARGRFVVFLDDDDELLPRYLEVARRELLDLGETVGFGWAGVRWVYDGETREQPREEIWKPVYADRAEAYRRFLVHRRVGSNCGLFVRPEALASVGGFDVELRGAEDTEFLIRMIRAYDFHVLPEVLVEIHLHDGSQLRRDASTRALCYEAIMARNREVIDADAAIRSSLSYKTAWLNQHAGRVGQARRHAWAAVRARPLSVRNWSMVAMATLLPRSGASIHMTLAKLKRRLVGRRTA